MQLSARVYGWGEGLAGTQTRPSPLLSTDQWPAADRPPSIVLFRAGWADRAGECLGSARARGELE